MSKAALREEGRIFLAQANAICRRCEHLTQSGIRRCGLCGCLASFKIIGGALHLSKCPADKW